MIVAERDPLSESAHHTHPVTTEFPTFSSVVYMHAVTESH